MRPQRGQSEGDDSGKTIPGEKRKRYHDKALSHDAALPAVTSDGSSRTPLGGCFGLLPVTRSRLSPVPRLTTEFTEGVRIAGTALRASKMRALLTTLGIVIGIVAVTSMFTVINGIEREFDRSMALIGDDALFVQRTPWFFTFDDWWKYRNRPPVEEELAGVIRERSRYAEAAVPLTGGGFTVQRGRQQMPNLQVEASTADYPLTGGADVETGRFFTDAESQAARPVVVLGADVVEELFPVEDPIGKEVRVSRRRFEVVGTLTERGSFLGLASADARAIVPLSTYRKLFNRDPDLSIKVRVASQEHVNAAEQELEGLVRLARGIDPMEENNFAINRQEQFRQLFQTMRVATYGVGIFLTALSLLVGGIGVMNIMFVSVKERTREIGIRKALGATQRAILLQFLMEAVGVCLVGGVIGVAIAALVALGINQVFTAVLSPGVVMLAFGMCALVGLAFGIIPAWQAARARPIEALRYE